MSAQTDIDKNNLLFLLACGAVVVSTFVILYMWKNKGLPEFPAPFTPSAVYQDVPAVKNTADLDAFSKELDNADTASLEKELNLLSVDASAF